MKLEPHQATGRSVPKKQKAKKASRGRRRTTVTLQPTAGHGRSGLQQ
jgi:hypothetical protein